MRAHQHKHAESWQAAKGATRRAPTCAHVVICGGRVRGKSAPKAEEERWVINEQVWMKENSLCLTGIKIAIVVVGTSAMIGVIIDIVAVV